MDTLLPQGCVSTGNVFMCFTRTNRDVALCVVRQMKRFYWFLKTHSSQRILAHLWWKRSLIRKRRTTTFSASRLEAINQVIDKMNCENRYSVCASLYMLREIKTRQENVKRAYQLLKRKAEALRIRGRQAAFDLTTTEAILGHTLKEAYISLAAIKFTNGESNALVLENIGQAQIRVQCIPENTSGVSTMLLRAVEVPSVGDVMKYAGLAAGGQRTAETKRAFREALMILLKFASHRNTCLVLNDALKSTLRKVNGIEKVIMPKLRNTEIYITMEIDEREREEFHRLKMVKARKYSKSIIKNRVQQKSIYCGVESHTSLVSSIESLECLGDARGAVACSSSDSTNIVLPICMPHHWDDEDLLF